MCYWIFTVTIFDTFIYWYSVGSIDTRAATNNWLGLIAQPQSWTSMRNFIIDQSDYRDQLISSLLFANFNRRKKTGNTLWILMSPNNRVFRVTGGKSLLLYVHLERSAVHHRTPTLRNAVERWGSPGVLMKGDVVTSQCQLYENDWDSSSIHLLTRGRSFTVGQWLTCSLFEPSVLTPFWLMWKKTTRVFLFGDVHTWGVNVKTPPCDIHRPLFHLHHRRILMTWNPVWKTILVPLGEKTHFDTKNNFKKL